MNVNPIPVLMLGSIMLILAYVSGVASQNAVMEKRAVKTHNAHYVVDENGSSTFQWNNQ